MALVFTQTGSFVRGARRIKEGNVTFTGATSYTAGGIATSAADYGLTKLDALDIVGVAGGDATFDPVNTKIILKALGGAQVANAGDPTGFTLLVQAEGRGAA